MWPSIVPTGALNEQLVTTLTDIQVKLRNLLSRPADQMYFDYYYVVDEAIRRLGHSFTAADLDRLLRSSTYWGVIGAQPMLPHVQKIVCAEIEALAARIGALADETRRAFDYWGPANYVVVDTNVYVEHDIKFYEIKWFQVIRRTSSLPVRMIVPQLVIDELDGLKAKMPGDNKKGNRPWRVRDTLRRFEDAFRTGRFELPDCRHEDVGDGVTIEALADPPMHSRLDVNDAEIVRRALDVQRLVGREVFLVSNDTNMLVRARLAGLEPVRLRPLVAELEPHPAAE